MKYEIYGEKQDKEEPVRLRLIKNVIREGDITVIAVDKKGRKVDYGNLITFKKNGRIDRHEFVNKELGFHLHPNGSIKTIEE